MLVILEGRKGCRLIIIITSLIAVKTQRWFRGAFPHGSNEREREREGDRESERKIENDLRRIKKHTHTHKNTHIFFTHNFYDYTYTHANFHTQIFFL